MTDLLFYGLLMESSWKSAGGNLRETFEVMEQVYSIDDIEQGVMEKIFEENITRGCQYGKTI